MITGRVNRNYEPIVSVELRHAGSTVQQIDALVDTGFNGWLTLPPRLVASLGLNGLRAGRVTLADGSEVTLDIYEAAINWNGSDVTIPIDESDSFPLIGMRLMDGLDLRIRVQPDGAVEIRAAAPV